MIFLVVSYQEVQGVKLKIKEADPRAFVVVTDAYDTFGEGWKQPSFSARDLSGITHFPTFKTENPTFRKTHDCHLCRTFA